jgi:predicted negative regulator of RcsB-dependent stress response
MTNETKSDFFTEFYFKATALFEANRNLFFGALGGVAALALALTVWNQSQSERNKEASLKLERIISNIDANRFDLAIEGDSLNAGLKKIVADYSGTEMGEKAKIYLGNAHFQKGNVDEALKAYESVSASSNLVKGIAAAGEAACYEQKKDFKKAAQLFRKASETVGNAAIAAIYLENAGRAFELAGEKADALSVYEKLKKIFPQTSAARNADQLIARLKG